MIRVIPLGNDQQDIYDSYVRKHPRSTIYHMYYFKGVVEKTYNHKSYYHIALNEQNSIVGILPIFLVHSIILGNSFVSLPFCDYGGILSDNAEITHVLFQKAIELSEKLHIKKIELRQTDKIDVFTEPQFQYKDKIHAKTSKVRMILSLPDSSEALFSSFPAKLRSQIRKPQKEGCTASHGGIELLDDFYEVFVHNMRDLGSPVHKKSMMHHMLTANPQDTRIFVIYHDKIPVACSLVGGLNKSLINPWASFKRTYQKISPNMMLYWEMLQYAISKGYRYFDFGRSTPDEGTYKFKEQWGAVPEQLFWYTYDSNGFGPEADAADNENSKESFIKIWRKLPLSVTRICGPILRKQIHL